MKDIEPDVIVEKVDGEIRVTANSDAMFWLRSNPERLKVVRTESRFTELNAPSNGGHKHLVIDLLDSVKQLQQILIDVTRGIFTVQADFLDQGVMGLKPLKLRQAAEFADVHESTVSRVIKDTHVKTPQGIHKLKFFFNTALEGNDGEIVLAPVVKVFIREIIEAEDPVKPLSDLAISNALLNSRGISIPRRTVAKWREESGILSANKRRKQQ